MKRKKKFGPNRRNPLNSSIEKEEASKEKEEASKEKKIDFFVGLWRRMQKSKVLNLVTTFAILRIVESASDETDTKRFLCPRLGLVLTLCLE